MFQALNAKARFTMAEIRRHVFSAFLHSCHPPRGGHGMPEMSRRAVIKMPARKASGMVRACQRSSKLAMENKLTYAKTVVRTWSSKAKQVARDS